MNMQDTLMTVSITIMVVTVIINALYDDDKIKYHGGIPKSRHRKRAFFRILIAAFCGYISFGVFGDIYRAIFFTGLLLSSAWFIFDLMLNALNPNKALFQVGMTAVLDTFFSKFLTKKDPGKASIYQVTTKIVLILVFYILTFKITL